jgi:hypothetical protein
MGWPADSSLSEDHTRIRGLGILLRNVTGTEITSEINRVNLRQAMAN